jgi:hypothetical protein
VKRKGPEPAIAPPGRGEWVPVSAPTGPGGSLGVPASGTPAPPAVLDLAESLILGRLLETEPEIQELFRQDLARLKADLSGGAATPLERLLADRVALCWLDATTLDVRATLDKGLTRAQIEHAERARDRAHRRFLSASRTLAQVRRIRLPAVQVNIARKQVNVAGGG